MGVTAVANTSFADGGQGAVALAQAIVSNIQTAGNHYHTLYKKEDSIQTKIETIAKEIYGADGVDYSSKAKAQLSQISKLGYQEYPVCMVKTPSSFSDDEKKIGRPKDFRVTVREFEYAGGAGFVIPILGDVMRMPGLPSVPNAEKIDIDQNEKISGLF